MISNAIVYCISSPLPTIVDVESELGKNTFTGCAPSQEKSSGWVPPREVNGLLAESVGGQWILRFMAETKTVPASVLGRKVDEMKQQIEATTGRKPGKKETRELKEDAKLALLPMAFTKQRATWVWIDPRAMTVVVDASSQAIADEVVTALVKSLRGLELQQLNTQLAPSVAMAEWLTTQEPSEGFSIDRECELKASDDTKAVVRYSKHPLDIEEVRQHIATGKVPTKLALTWDDRVSFVLTDTMQLKKISFLDVVFDGNKPEDSGFDADAAIMAGELAALLVDLVEALGGENGGAQ